MNVFLLPASSYAAVLPLPDTFSANAATVTRSVQTEEKASVRIQVMGSPATYGSEVVADVVNDV